MLLSLCFQLAVLLIVGFATCQQSISSGQIPSDYGSGQKGKYGLLNDISEEVEGLEIVAKLEQLFEKVEKHNGIEKKQALKEILEFINSEKFRHMLSKLPKDFREIVNAIVESVMSLATKNDKTDSIRTSSYEDDNFDLIDLLESIKVLLTKISKEGIASAKAQILTFRSVMTSQSMTAFIQKLPSEWRMSVQKIVEKINAFIDIGVDKMTETVRKEIKALINAIQGDLEAQAFSKKLHEFLVILKEKSLVSLEKVKSGLRTILNNSDFQHIEEELQQVTKNMIRMLREHLKTDAQPVAAEGHMPEVLKKLKDEVNGLQLIAKLQKLSQKVKTQVGVARDLTIQRLMSIIKSERVQLLLKTVPEEFESLVRKIVEKIKSLSKGVSGRLHQFVEESSETIGQLIEHIKEQTTILQGKLEQAVVLIRQDLIEAREAGRARLLEILTSEDFLEIVLTLPKSLQDKLSKLLQHLRS